MWVIWIDDKEEFLSLYIILIFVILCGCRHFVIHINVLITCTWKLWDIFTFCWNLQHKGLNLFYKVKPKKITVNWQIGHLCIQLCIVMLPFIHKRQIKKGISFYIDPWFSYTDVTAIFLSHKSYVVKEGTNNTHRIKRLSKRIYFWQILILHLW